MIFVNTISQIEVFRKFDLKWCMYMFKYMILNLIKYVILNLIKFLTMLVWPPILHAVFGTVAWILPDMRVRWREDHGIQ